jgi:hypothetical protein
MNRRNPNEELIREDVKRPLQGGRSADELRAIHDARKARAERDELAAESSETAAA